MSNQNDPWENEPDPRGRGAGAGDGDPRNYALLLVPMLGLAAYRWIWERWCQREIQEVKAQNKIDLSIITSDLETKLEKEMQRVKGFKKPMVSQSHLLMEEWKQLQEPEFSQSQRAKATLKELEHQLLECQHVYCSYTQRRDQRLEMEKNLLIKVIKDPVLPELNLEYGLKDIFKRDTHCAGLLNSDKRQNGSLMWKYLKHWQDTVQKHKWAE